MAAKREVLNSFKRVIRTAQEVFHGDQRAIQSARDEARKKFLEKKDVADQAEIATLVKTAHEVADTLKACVIQAVRQPNGNYRLKFRPDFEFQDNSVRQTFPPEEVREYRQKCAEAVRTEAAKKKLEKERARENS